MHHEILNYTRYIRGSSLAHSSVRGLSFIHSCIKFNDNWFTIWEGRYCLLLETNVCNMTYTSLALCIQLVLSTLPIHWNTMPACSTWSPSLHIQGTSYPSSSTFFLTCDCYVCNKTKAFRAPCREPAEAIPKLGSPRKQLEPVQAVHHNWYLDVL